MDSLNNIEFAIHQQRDEYIEDLFVKKRHHQSTYDNLCFILQYPYSVVLLI